jgi:hypothetical protein
MHYAQTLAETHEA